MLLWYIYVYGIYAVGHKNTPTFFCRNFYNTVPILIEIDMQK